MAIEEIRRPFPAGISLPAVWRQVEKILASASFVHSERMSRFLRFVVEQTIRDPKIELKEHQLGIEVFDKPESFDPRVDSIVRVEARRLRSKLREYYDTEGLVDPVEVTLSERRYAAVIRQRGSRQMPDSQWKPPSPPAWSTIAIQPFAALSTARQVKYFSQGLTEELTNAFTKLEGLRVLSWSPQFSRAPQRLRDGARPDVTAILGGSVRMVGETVRISARLVNVADGSLLWTQIYERKAGDLFADQDEICSAVVRSVLRIASTAGRIPPQVQTNVSVPARSEPLSTVAAAAKR